jgi:high-affinity K+ transport system ATPase subunit B
MSKKQNKKFITPEILRGAVKGAFVKLNPRYMMRNPVMFVVEIGCFITLLLSFFPGLFGDVDAGSLRIYDIIVCVILFITVLFANFAEAVAEGRGKAQAASLKKTQKDTEAHLLHEDGSETIVRSSELKKGDIVLVVAGEVIPGDGEVIEGIASVDESAITGESAPVVRESGGDFFVSTNAALRRAAKLFEQTEGIDIHHAAAVAVDSLIQAVKQGKVGREDVVMLNVTGGGERRYKAGRQMWYLKPSIVFPLTASETDIIGRTEALFVQ